MSFNHQSPNGQQVPVTNPIAMVNEFQLPILNGQQVPVNDLSDGQLVPTTDGWLILTTDLVGSQSVPTTTDLPIHVTDVERGR